MTSLADSQMTSRSRTGRGSRLRRVPGTLALMALYYYIGDRHPGQVLCEDVEEFGGRWYVVTRRGSAVV
jgi:hypothetical protein